MNLWAPIRWKAHKALVFPRPLPGLSRYPVQPRETDPLWRTLYGFSAACTLTAMKEGPHLAARLSSADGEIFKEEDSGSLCCEPKSAVKIMPQHKVATIRRNNLFLIFVFMRTEDGHKKIGSRTRGYLSSTEEEGPENSGSVCLKKGSACSKISPQQNPPDL